MQPRRIEFYELPIPLDRDRFVRDLLRAMTASVEKAVGPERAADMVAEIGESTGEQINIYYRAALKTTRLTDEQIAAAMVGNRACPFGAKVKDRPALCMMTSSVFGTIASRNRGYAKVELQQTIAQHAEQCRVVVYLKPTEEARTAPGREFVDRG